MSTQFYDHSASLSLILFCGLQYITMSTQVHERQKKGISKQNKEINPLMLLVDVGFFVVPPRKDLRANRSLSKNFLESELS